MIFCKLEIFLTNWPSWVCKKSTWKVITGYLIRNNKRRNSLSIKKSRGNWIIWSILRVSYKRNHTDIFPDHFVQIWSTFWSVMTKGITRWFAGSKLDPRHVVSVVDDAGHFRTEAWWRVILEKVRNFFLENSFFFVNWTFKKARFLKIRPANRHAEIIVNHIGKRRVDYFSAITSLRSRSKIK